MPGSHSQRYWHKGLRLFAFWEPQGDDLPQVTPDQMEVLTLPNHEA